MNSRQTEVQVVPPQYERPLPLLDDRPLERRTRGETEATTERKEAFQIIQWLNSTKLIFLTEYSKMKKNICTEHQNMRTIVSSPAVYRGDYDPPHVHTNTVTKSAWVQNRETAQKPTGWCSWKIKSATNWNKKRKEKNPSENQEFMEKRLGHGKRVQNNQKKKSC